MFKVKKTEYTNKTFRIPNGLIEKMEAIAQNKGVSLNNLVVQCCEYALENIEQAEDLHKLTTKEN
jgi:predicted HicB family RNase H-like nuclease